MRCRKVIKIVKISNGLFFFERCSLIHVTATVCAKQIIMRKRTLFNLYAHAVAIIRLHLSKKYSSLPLKPELPSYFTDNSVPKEFQKNQQTPLVINTKFEVQMHNCLQ